MGEPLGLSSLGPHVREGLTLTLEGDRGDPDYQVLILGHGGILDYRLEIGKELRLLSPLVPCPTSNSLVEDVHLGLVLYTSSPD